MDILLPAKYLLFMALVAGVNCILTPDPLITKSTPEMIKYNGYPVEIHEVTTNDGYILEVHRIPYGIKDRNAPRNGRPPVLLQHCLLCSSADFVMNTPDKALAYMLADEGYDVWMGNVRGNTYCKRHISLKPNQKKFWQFSWDEMAYYDIPAIIDHILDVTNRKDLYYVGFSMGTTIYWAMMNVKPDYSSKIRLMVALGPAAYVKHAIGPLAQLSSKVKVIESVANFFGLYELLSFGYLIDKLIAAACDERVFGSAICKNLLFQLTGSNPKQLNKPFLPVILSHTPAGTSIFTFTHYLKEVNSGKSLSSQSKFQKYDYGEVLNLQKYNSTIAPLYSLSKVTTPVAIFSSKNDWFAAPKDVERLRLELPNVVYNKYVEDPMFTHLDFVWAKDADKLVYKDIINILANF